MKPLQHSLFGILVLAFTGFMLVFTPFGQKLEEAFGLGLLFHLRGPREAPPKAVIINIDDVSLQQLGLEKKYRNWPRTVHARLVEKLSQYGAKVIVFDIHFGEEKSPVADLAFAEAVKNAGNVVLVEKLHHTSTLSFNQSNVASGVEVETLLPPIQPLADAALALAPFPLPKLPVRVDHAWLFKESADNIPTLPVSAFQALTFQYYDDLRRMLEERSYDTSRLPDSSQQALVTLGMRETMGRLKEIALQNSSWQDDLLPESEILKMTQETQEVQRLLAALFHLYRQESFVPIDFYGPPATLTTLSYYDILAADEKLSESVADLIEDKVVFVGAASKTWSNQKDGFYTVFSQADGLDLSGVELAATVFLNVYERRIIQKLSALHTLGLIVGSVVICWVISFFLRPLYAVPVLMGGVGCALLAATNIFSVNALWLPMVVPFIFLPIFVFFLTSSLNYLSVLRERKHISTALGYYLPDNVVKELTKDLSFIQQGNKMVYGVCLMTDAENYTSLSENNDPQVVSALMNAYYECLFCEVKERKGMVCNVIGDAMLAMWPASQQPQAILRENGCKAALQIVEAVEEFNRKHKETPLPTRIGLHSGDLLVGNIGTEDHFEYAPIGDIVNTASRIEGLNKKLATRVLASSETLDGVNGVSSREVGMFIFSGKTQPVAIHEIIAEDGQTPALKELYNVAFPEALTLFQDGRWSQAGRAFERCLALDGEDGPSHFYKSLCEAYSFAPPSGDWQGVVTVSK